MVDRLSLLIRSGHTIIAIQTRDEIAGLALVRETADKVGLPLYEWSATRGILQTRPSEGDPGVKGHKAIDALEFTTKNKGAKEIFLFRDLAAHATDPLIQRHLRDLHLGTKTHLILLDSAPLPDALRSLAVTIRIPLPEPLELEKAVKDTFREVDRTSYEEVTASLSREDMDQLVHLLRGLTRAEAVRVVASAIHDDNVLDASDLPRIVEAKRNLLESSGCLEAIAANVSAADVGGLANLKQWLSRRRGGLTSAGRDFGLEAPRGILLLGVQGCGKSLCARVVAADWRLPLLRMDPGVLYQKYIGESENRLRDALAQAEAMAPAILWIDEIEKAFASASSASADGGLSQRMFGTLLTWMQDHSSPIFIVATANNISALPPELMRKGRFDEVFFVDLPNDRARLEILQIQLTRRNRAPKSFDLSGLTAATQGFSGAEIEQAVKGAMYIAFSEQKELSTEYLLTEIRQTRPLSVLMAETVHNLREWAKGRCVSAE